MPGLSTAPARQTQLDNLPDITQNAYGFRACSGQALPLQRRASLRTGFPEDKSVNRRTIINALKYALAIGLLSYVVYSNWGYKEKVASQIQEGDVAADASSGRRSGSLVVVGTVKAYEENQ